jgi:hypothetical protein
MRKSRKAVVVGGTAAALIGAGVAYAYWTTSGTGSGSASTGTSSNFAVTTDPATGPALSPGSTNQQTVAFHVKNNDSGVQRLTNVVVSVKNSDGTAWTSGTCSAADYQITQATVPPTDLASGATYSNSITIKMLDTGLNQDDCKGVTVPLYVQAS